MKNKISSFHKYIVNLLYSTENKTLYFFLLIISLIALVIYKDYVFQQKIFWFVAEFVDSTILFFPIAAHSADYIKHFGFPSWSFNIGMGRTLLDLSVTDPFDFFLYPFGKHLLPRLVVYKEIGKIILTGFIFCKYLKLLKVDNYVALIGSLCIAFCPYMIMGGLFYVFSYEIFTTVFLLWAFEMLFQKRKWYWFCIAVLLTVIKPLNSWMLILFFVPYILFRVYQSDGKFQIRQNVRLLGLLVGASVIGIGLSAPLLLEIIQAMMDSPRVSGGYSYVNMLSSTSIFQPVDRYQLGTAIMRLFSSDILGTDVNYKGWYGGIRWYFESPLFYCGLPCLLLLPQAFQFFIKPVKRFAIVLLLIWLIPLFFPYFRYAMWLFSGNYYRNYSFFISLLMIFYSVLALDNIIRNRKVNLITLGVTLLVLFILINYPYFPGKLQIVDSTIRQIVEGLLVYYTILLVLLHTGKISRSVFKGLFLILLLGELTYSGQHIINHTFPIRTNDLTQVVGYNDYSNNALAYIRKTDTSSFYRIDKNYGSAPAMLRIYSVNDGMVQDYYGTSAYYSFNHRYYINYLKTMDVISKTYEQESRWTMGLTARPLLEVLNSVKYFLDKPRNSNSIPVSTLRYNYSYLRDSMSEKIGQFGDVAVSKNNYSLPLGYAYDSYIRLSNFDGLSPLQKDVMSAKVCVVSDEELNKVSSLRAIPSNEVLGIHQCTMDTFKYFLNIRNTHTFQITEFNKPTLIKGIIDVPIPSMLYLSIPFDKGWSATDNDQPIEKLILSGGMTGLLLSPGNHSIELKYTSVNFNRGLYIAFISLCVFVGIIIYQQKAKKAQ